MYAFSLRSLTLLHALLLFAAKARGDSEPYTRFRGDLPLAVPVLVSDSASTGSIYGQLALRISNGTPYERGAAKPWSTTPVGASLQMQWVKRSCLHLKAGASWGGSASAWGGPVLATRAGRVRWEFEILGGATKGASTIHEIETKTTWAFFGDNTVETVYVGGGEAWRGWGQLAARAQSLQRGPWLEVRTLPVFLLGQAESAGGETKLSGWPILSIGAGWSHECWKSIAATGGMRVVTVDGGLPDPQLLLGIQTKL